MNPAPRQHTPGPWRTEPAPHRSNWSLGATSVALTTEPNEANARLIAAAPELLAAARLAVAWSEQVPAPYRDWPHVAAARAAIAKATGGAA